MADSKAGHDEAVVLAEEESSRLDTSHDIIRLVLMGVDGVVHQRPAHACCVEGQADGPVQVAGGSHIPQQCTPVEGQAQKCLRLQAHAVMRSDHSTITDHCIA